MGPGTADATLIDCLGNDFEALLDACWAEVEGTASREVLTALHGPRLRAARTDALYYLETLVMRDLCIAKLTGAGKRERGELAALENRVQGLRIAAKAEARAQAKSTARPDAKGPKGFEQMCGWLLGLLLPREYGDAFAKAMRGCGLEPERTRLPSTGWWRWAVERGWMQDTPTPEAIHLLSLDDEHFADQVRRTVAGQEVPGSESPAVVERWDRAFKGIELRVRADLDHAVSHARQARGNRTEPALDRIRERYEELAELRVRRSIAFRAYLALRERIIEAVDAEGNSLRQWCSAVAADEVAAAYPALWQRVRVVVWRYRKDWDRAEFDFEVHGGALADRLRIAIRTTADDRAELATRTTARSEHIPSGPLTVATDASGYGQVGGFGWAAADGRSGGGRCVDGESSVESELIAICDTAVAAELSGRELRILSDCEQAVVAVNAVLRRRSPDALPFTVSRGVLRHVRNALCRTLPFRAEWVPGHDGHVLNEEAHRLARAARW
ncbi:RNase H family protein [Nocardia jejuensis]|uniref:RNase H family protein n=1 Tax=Nocardia jejuensis TaxID=328049 RepID=UPI000829B930|nr:RNase H family protein [Nocardia jejuensis]